MISIADDTTGCKPKSNGLRMSFAEWLWHMAVAKLSPSKRMVATYAGAFNITSNSDLERLTGLSEDTLRTIKQQLPNDGFICLEPGIGGRGHGLRISPALNKTPLTFTDLSARNPRKYYPPNSSETPREITPLISQTPGGFQGVPKKVSPAPPSKNLLLTKVEQEDRSNNLPLVEQEAARGGGYDPDFPALNGTAVELVKFIGRSVNVTEREARVMLKANVQAFGAEAMLEAFAITVGDMASSLIAAPYKYLIGCARNAKDKPRRGKITGNRMSLDEMGAVVDAAYERQFSHNTRSNRRLTDER